MVGEEILMSALLDFWWERKAWEQLAKLRSSLAQGSENYNVSDLDIVMVDPLSTLSPTQQILASWKIANYVFIIFEASKIPR